jgi:hypothetical protein
VYHIEHQSKIKDDSLGECDFEKKVLKIPYDGDTMGEMDAIIHGALHACFPFLMDDEIERSATDVARLLWRLDWRKSPDPE